MMPDLRISVLAPDTAWLPSVVLGFVGLATIAQPVHAEAPSPDRAPLPAQGWPSRPRAGGDPAYSALLEQGDRHVLEVLHLRKQERLETWKAAQVRIELGLAAYRLAIATAPNLPEAYFRLGDAVDGLWGQCDRRAHVWCPPPNARAVYAREGTTAWAKFLELAPDDPRAWPLKLDVAIAYTKLATPDDLHRAKQLYRAAIERMERRSPTAIANLAEVQMMLGELADAIAGYQAALALEPNPATAFGLAVAYDRAGQHSEAVRVIRRQGDAAVVAWQNSVLIGSTFYVPEGERYYYEGLIFAAQGHASEAITAFSRYLRSPAGAQFRQTAEQRVAMLRGSVR